MRQSLLTSACFALIVATGCTDRAISSVAPPNEDALAAPLRPSSARLPFAGPAVAPPLSGVISNGLVMMGVVPEGALNLEANYPSSVLDYSQSPAFAQTKIGLRYMPTNTAATEQGCACEGWGVGDIITQTYGGRNVDADTTQGRPVSPPNVPTVESFTTTPTTAVSVVQVKHNVTGASMFRVTHDYHPSPKSPSLYEVKVVIENISGATTNVRYRRTMDWDVEPTPFNEYVTLVRGTSPRIERMTNNPFQSTDVHRYLGTLITAPYLAETTTDTYHGDTYAGAIDAGANFDFVFGQLAPGAKRTFYTYYGAGANEQTVLDALGAAGVEAYSLAQASNVPRAALVNNRTFAFAFRDIEGSTLLPNKSPIITHTVTGASSVSGWYTGSPVVQFNVTAGAGGGSITSSSGCSPVTVSTNTVGTTYICQATNSLNLSTADTVVVKRDANVPIVTPTVAGTVGANGWYTSNVTVTWAVSNVGPSGLASAPCPSSTLSTDAVGTTFTCSATTVAGLTSGPVPTPVINRDATKPSVTLSGPAGTVSPATVVTITCAVSDATSGIDAAATVCPAYSGPAYGLGAGSITLLASAKDMAGNAQSATSTFTVLLNTSILCALTQQHVDSKGNATALCAILAAASKAKADGDVPRYTQLMNTYVAAVQALNDKFISASNRQLLIGSAIALGATTCSGTPSNGVGNPNNGNQGSNGKCNGNSGNR